MIYFFSWTPANMPFSTFGHCRFLQVFSLRNGLKKIKKKFFHRRPPKCYIFGISVENWDENFFSSYDAEGGGSVIWREKKKFYRKPRFEGSWVRIRHKKFFAHWTPSYDGGGVPLKKKIFFFENFLGVSPHFLGVPPHFLGVPAHFLGVPRPMPDPARPLPPKGGRGGLPLYRLQYS